MYKPHDYVFVQMVSIRAALEAEKQRRSKVENDLQVSQELLQVFEAFILLSLYVLLRESVFIYF